MVEKEEHTITLLLCLHLLTLVLVCCVDTDIDFINKTIDEIAEVQAEQNESYWHLSEDVDTRLNEIDARVEETEHQIELHHIRLFNHYQLIGEMSSSVDVLNDYLPTPTPIPQYAVNVSVTESDIRNIAALVYLEAGSQSYACQKAVASVIFNRMMRYNKTASQVIWENGVFSPAARVRSTTPSQGCIQAVREVLSNGATLPSNVLAFRNGHYHNFGRHYCQIDGVYFTQM